MVGPSVRSALRFTEVPRRTTPRLRSCGLRRSFFVLGLSLLLTASCRSAGVPSAERAMGTGVVGFEYAAEVRPTLPKLEGGQEYRAAYALPENPLPEYPPQLLPLGLPRQEVVVRVVIGSDGAVLRFEDSPVPSRVDPRYASDFGAAVRTAVREWRFEPAFIRTFEPGPDNDGDGKSDFPIMRGSEQLTSYHDLRFAFEIRAGRGVVNGK